MLLRKEPLLAIMPRDHRLRSSSVVDVTDLGGETFIGVSGTAPVLRPIVQDYVHGSHAEVVPVGEADYLEMAARVSKKSRESLSAWIHCS